MKKLLSLILCAVMLCSALVFPTSAEDEMTVEKFEKQLFGEHYVTDAEAAKFALAGYPGVTNTEFINNKACEEISFYIGSISSYTLLLLDEYFPGLDYTIHTSHYNNQSVISFILTYTDDTVAFASSFLDIKILYILVQLMAEINGGISRGAVTVIPESIIFGGEPSWRADVNEDGKINAKDILTINRFIVGIDYRIAFHNDPNNDKAINAKDILQIKRYIVGVDDYPGYVYRPNPDNPEERFWNPIKGYFAIPGM